MVVPSDVPFTERTSRGQLYVILQCVLLAAYPLPVRLLSWPPGQWGNTVGSFLMAFGLIPMVVALVQLRQQFSPFPAPVRSAGLITTGAFAVARHPIYFGLLMMGLGLSLYTGSAFRLLLTALLTVLFYGKSAYEERLLAEVFPAYADYRTRVNRFLTFPWKGKGSEQTADRPRD